MAAGPGPASRSGSIAQTKTPVFKEKLLTGEKFLKWTDQVCFQCRLSEYSLPESKVYFEIG